MMPRRCSHCGQNGHNSRREHSNRGPRAMGRGAHTVGRKKVRPLTSDSTTAVSTGSGKWAELPQGPLLLVFDRLPSIVDLFAVAAVCRFWRFVASQHASATVGDGRPPLLLSPIIDGGRWIYPRRCRLLSPTDPATSHRCMVPFGTLASPVIGYSHGHLISCCGHRPLLINVATGGVLQAPKLPPTFALQHGVLTAPPSAPGCNLLLLSCYQGTAGSYLRRWQVGEREWSFHDLEQCTMFMYRITVFKGQIFILDLCGSLFTVEFFPHFHVTELLEVQPRRADGRRWPIPDLMELVECEGELMLVRFVCVEETPCSMVKVEVFRLDLSRPPSWVKVESLGERALFIDVEHGSSASCRNPNSWGGRSNCIYLTRRALGTWTVLPLDHPTSQWFERAKNSSMKWPAPIWVFPSMRYDLEHRQ